MSVTSYCLGEIVIVVFYTAFLLWLYLVVIAGVWAVDCDAVVVSI